MPERFFDVGTDEVDIHLVHHTGRMIRFRPSLVRVMPPQARNVTIALPQGERLPGHFNPNPRNPNVTGRDLVAWIRSQVDEGKTLPARLREIEAGVLEVVMPGPTLADVDERRILPRDLARRARELRRQRDRTRLKRSLRVWERNPRLRRSILDLWEPRCQVRGCPIADTLPGDLQAAVVELHHVTHVSAGGSDDPLNLCVLCAAHHRLVHRAGSSEVEEAPNGTVVIRLDGYELVVERNLGALLR